MVQETKEYVADEGGCFPLIDIQKHAQAEGWGLRAKGLGFRAHGIRDRQIVDLVSTTLGWGGGGNIDSTIL